MSPLGDPARIARHVEHWGEGVPTPDGQELLTDDAGDLRDQIGIPGTGEADRRRKDGGGSRAARGGKPTYASGSIRILM
jgi:hypothetical protein